MHKSQYTFSFACYTLYSCAGCCRNIGYACVDTGEELQLRINLVPTGYGRVLSPAYDGDRLLLDTKTTS